MRLRAKIGRGMVVDHALLADVAFSLTGRDPVAVTVSGTIFESAKVFDDLTLTRDGQVLRLRVTASLAFWNRAGSPDFRVTRELDLAPGTYDVRYVNEDGTEVPMHAIEVPG